MSPTAFSIARARRSVGAVGERGAAALGGVGVACVRVRGHSACAPSRETDRVRTETSGKRASSSCAHARADSGRAHTITVGAGARERGAERGGGRVRRARLRGAARPQRGTARAGDRRAPRRTGRVSPSRAPLRAARRARTVNAASSCATCSGSAARAAAVETVASGTSAMGTAGASSASRAILVVPREADAPGERRRQVVGVTLEPDSLGEQLLRARATAPPPRLRRRARGR